MNLNDFVKIKLIDWKDNSMSKYVNGVVFTKSLDDRNMKNEFVQPSLLLLKDTQEIGLQDLQSEIE